MSGTSIDAVDAVLVDLRCPQQPALLSSHSHPIPPALRTSIEALCQPGSDEINRMGQLDRQLGDLFSEAVLRLLETTGTKPSAIRAIGSHGQTVRHHPAASPPFTLQIGDPHTIALRTGITTIADFRRMDVAAGGQGAPLVPAFHDTAFRHASEKRVVVNIGGMANLTVLAPAHPVSGFDTGPGNVLMDTWIQKHLQRNFDRDGQWAASGHCDTVLLNQLLSHPFLAIKGPKSTGREAFHIAWLESQLDALPPINAADVQRTLLEFTARSITAPIHDLSVSPVERIILCGGGSHNTLLKSRIAALLEGVKVNTSDELGVPADWVEAIAFAWLAKQRLEGKPGNIPEVTGASKACVLGAIYPAC